VRSNQLVTYRVSSRAGFIKSAWVIEVRSDGWVRISNAPDVTSYSGTWIAPQNVLGFHTPQGSYDYGGISEGTLVQVWDKTGVVVRRRGARYDVLIEGIVSDTPWELVRPLEEEREEG
jgi:hypothetical protein